MKHAACLQTDAMFFHWSKASPANQPGISPHCFPDMGYWGTPPNWQFQYGQSGATIGFLGVLVLGISSLTWHSRKHTVCSNTDDLRLWTAGFLDPCEPAGEFFSKGNVCRSPNCFAITKMFIPFTSNTGQRNQCACKNLNQPMNLES